MTYIRKYIKYIIYKLCLCIMYVFFRPTLFALPYFSEYKPAVSTKKIVISTLKPSIWTLKPPIRRWVLWWINLICIHYHIDTTFNG